ncbi:MAG TPA: cellulase family glycosylhydrolase [Pseudobacteroides sp.]|uniref:cellulase family glycosylhydrolase n=1 Tax=Pseudobacteroides sp. TaxID=1968840 RepID=UPI002F929610
MFLSKRKLSVFLMLTILISMIFSMSFNNSYAASTPYGQLKVVGSQLCNQSGQPVVLKGMSSHGLQWYGNFMNTSSIKTLKDSWGATVVRAAMYTAENGYISNPAAMKSKVKEIVQAAIDLGIYVIIDWHILSDGDPNTYKTQAKEFFKEMATTYGSYPNVIYEICNEPNGNASWTGQIKPYAQEVIPVIRAADPDGIVIVGTSNWSQDVDIAANSPLSYSNVMYACHFYAGTHGQFLRDKITYAMNKGIAVFVTEWGTSDASGNGGPYLTEAKTWLDFFASKKISWCNWSLCDKNESSAALAAGASTLGGWTDANLTASGKFVKLNMSGGIIPSTIAPTPTPTLRPTATPTLRPSTTATPTLRPSSSVRPTATPTSTPAATPTNSSPSVTYTIQNSWGSGATINITVKNNSSSAINNWSLKFAFTGNQKITNSWNAISTQSGTAVTITGSGHTSNIPANGSVNFGFNISYSGTNSKPGSFTLNGIPCTIQ